MSKVFLKSIFHNIVVVFVGLGVGFAGVLLDSFFGIRGFVSDGTTLSGLLLITVGFLIRVWAVIYFYKYNMRVILLRPQKKLLTEGPYRFSRNPLYLGGNFFIFLGAALFFGTPLGLILVVINLFIVNYVIQREEKQLAKQFGKEWTSYKKRVRRWI